MIVGFAALFLSAETLTEEQARGKDVFQACSGCHNVLTDARKAGPSLRTLYGKVRLRNGKRTLDDNVAQLILDGYNNMPSYKNMFRPGEWSDLLAYLKTLRARPEIGAVLTPIRGNDNQVLATGKKLYAERCASCHKSVMYERELAMVARIRDNHGKTIPEPLDEGALFSLIAWLKSGAGS